MYTQSRGAGFHYHSQQFAGVTRTKSWRTDAIETRTFSNSVREFTHWYVLVEAITETGTGAICVR